MEIIIRDKNKIKGKSVVEMAKNLVSEGYPPEVGGETLDKIRFAEKRYGPEIFKHTGPKRWLKGKGR